MNTAIGSRRSPRTDIWVAIALAAAVLSIYGRAAGNGFINLDDDTYITGNPSVLRGLSFAGVRWAFTTLREANWHPLTWISHMLDVSIWGTWPGGHHLTSVLIHALNAVLLFAAFRAMTGELWPPALLAAAFALHPLRVESVAWAAERKDVLSALFWFAAMLAYAWYARRPGPSRMAVVALLLLLGLLAKPMLVTLPFALLLVDYWPLRRYARGPGGGSPAFGAGRAVWEKLPLFALSAASSAVTAWVQHRGGAAPSVEEVPPLARLVNAAVSYATYLRKTVWPSDLAVFYPHPALVSPHVTARQLTMSALAAVALAAVTVAVLRAARIRPYLAVGWLWYLGTLVPVLGLVQVGRQGLADRYTYVPHVGIFMMLAWGARDLVAARPRLRGAVVAVSGATLAALSAATWLRVGLFRDGETLYRHALRVTTNNFLVHNNLGVIYLDQGRSGEAMGEFEAALNIRRDYAEALGNLGLALENAGRLDEAEKHLREAIRLRPDLGEAHNSLGNLFRMRGDPARARGEFEEALRVSPGHPDALSNLGTLLAEQGDLAGAETNLRAALRVAPAKPEIRRNLGIVLMRRGKIPEATVEYQEAVRLRPDDAAARHELGQLLAHQGRFGEAEACFEEVLRLRPDLAAAHASLAEVLDRQGKSAQAAIHRQEAARLSPRGPRQPGAR